MKLFSTLTVLMLLVAFPGVATETATEVPNPMAPEVLVTPMEQAEPAAADGLGALMGETGFLVCFPEDLNYCASDSDCTWPCTCNRTTNCCYND